ncbi:hypothetical protein Cyast_1543 [Cyanobacterium stanieri PCC 7202]|uniref:Uncharacterized protein n=1 Tax=Cyanobacterium stanieri (strain ATCC 29140 / PCC 7202) TaxID=292563 RepID=K9YKV2_CYASC|nr:hypothetical protein Cyast_1543 [Cyanobacterium stanieri PCC 7202]
MTKNTLKGNQKSRVTSYNLEVSRPQPRKRSVSPDTKRYALKTVSKKPVGNTRKKTNQNQYNNIKKTSRKKSNAVNENGILKYLIVVTCTIFTFGSLGFGYTLRYANKWQELMSEESGIPNTLIQGQEVIKQEMMKELRINN